MQPLLNLYRPLATILLSLALLFVMPPVMYAQDLDEIYEWDNGVVMDYPDDWDTYIDDSDVTHFTSDETDMFIIFDDYDEDDPLDEYIEDAFEEYVFDQSARFDDDDVVIGDLGEFDETASYFYEEELNDEEFERGIIAIPLSDDIIVIAVVVPITDDEIDELDTVFDMLATLRTGGSSTSTANGDVFEFDNGTQIELIDDWSEQDEVFTNGTLDVTLTLYPVIDERTDTRAGRLRQAFGDVTQGDATYDEATLVFLILDVDDEALQYLYEDTNDGDTYSVGLIAVSVDADTIIIVHITPSDTDDEQAVTDNISEVWDFLETLDD